MSFHKRDWFASSHLNNSCLRKCFDKIFYTNVSSWRTFNRVSQLSDFDLIVIMVNLMTIVSTYCYSNDEETDDDNNDNADDDNDD